MIYATIPFVRTVRDAFAARWPAELIAYAVIAVVLGALVTAIVFCEVVSNTSRQRRPPVAGRSWQAPSSYGPAV